MIDGGRWRGFGKPHGGIPPPIWNPPKGKAYPATANQNPPTYNYAKFSESINGKPPSGNHKGKSKDDLTNFSKPIKDEPVKKTPSVSKEELVKFSKSMGNKPKFSGYKGKNKEV
jgi:hypothetical protein